jgi:hypothetical protein
MEYIIINVEILKIFEKFVRDYMLKIYIKINNKIVLNIKI